MGLITLSFHVTYCIFIAFYAFVLCDICDWECEEWILCFQPNPMIAVCFVGCFIVIANSWCSGFPILKLLSVPGDTFISRTCCRIHKDMYFSSGNSILSKFLMFPVPWWLPHIPTELQERWRGSQFTWKTLSQSEEKRLIAYGASTLVATVSLQRDDPGCKSQAANHRVGFGSTFLRLCLEHAACDYCRLTLRWHFTLLHHHHATACW